MLLLFLFAGLLFFRYAKDQSFSSRIAIFISIVVIPIIFDRLWSWQQNQMYDSAYEDNRFAITTGIFQHDRTENYVERLLPDLMALSFNFSSPAFLGFLGILLSLSIGILLMRSSLLKRILIYIVFLYFIYIAFLYILYLFIMPDATVGNLVAFNRYQGSILIFLCGIGVFFLKEALLKQKSNTSNAKLRWTTFSVLLFFVPISTQVNEFNIDPNYDQSNRVPVVNQFKELRAVTDLNHSDHIIIVDVDEESSPIFLRYLVMFERLSRAQTQVQHCDNANEFVEILNSGEYLMLYNYDEGFSDC
ncbi:hypothetical protein [Geomicrobium sp. JCM 19038]|uniref:hypothetical protein n=1 Tax=Geomicrobium sp. JCM 19038 TaxID=1460635 RepID=UPI00045F45DA|nr:hypothetical protein [Geomicrobium sp. JCM 19038]GAK07093.1 hypothetical protein JCM19038_813 [Geomicrobium sp. JCM 19038]